MAETKKKHHFVLVHGACHGAWSWYKVKPRLVAAGHRVTTLDMAASGINRKSIQELHKFEEYSKPLLDFLDSIDVAGSCPDEKVVLVGHSLGGLNLAMAIDRFPDKISVAFFVAAFMPDTKHKPSYVLDQYLENSPAEAWLDTKFEPYGADTSSTSMFFGPNFMQSKLYQLSPPEDLELALTLARPGSLFVNDLSGLRNFSNEGYGSVSRVYVVCEEDKAITKDFQLWMIDNFPVKEVIEIEGADHFPMFSKPQQLCDCLLEMADKYA